MKTKKTSEGSHFSNAALTDLWFAECAILVGLPYTINNRNITEKAQLGADILFEMKRIVEIKKIKGEAA